MSLAVISATFQQCPFQLLEIGSYQFLELNQRAESLAFLVLHEVVSNYYYKLSCYPMHLCCARLFPNYQIISTGVWSFGPRKIFDFLFCGFWKFYLVVFDLNAIIYHILYFYRLRNHRLRPHRILCLIAGRASDNSHDRLPTKLVRSFFSPNIND